MSEMVTLPEVVPLPFSDRISLLCGGGGHVLIYTASNMLFACGWNNKGQLGFGDTIDRSSFGEVCLQLEPDERILQLSCGWDTSAVLTTDHRLFVFGGNAFYQLGLEDTKENILSPRQITLPGALIPLQVELSMRQIVVRTKDRILISGKSQAVKDIRSGDEKGTFAVLQSQSEVTVIASGQHHFIYTTQQKQVIGIGQNKFNQSENLTFPGEILQIRSGWTHNACLLLSGDVYLWGRNTYGQLGNGKLSTSEADPVKLKIPEKVQEIHLGSEHGLVQCVDGSVYTWGWNEHGNCGDGSEENVLKPFKIPLLNKLAVKSTCGAGFCFIVTANKTNE